MFDPPDYSAHSPIKKKTLDVNNVKDKQRQQDHLYSDLFGQSGTSYKTPVVQNKPKTPSQSGKKPSAGRACPNFNRKDAKFSNLKSALDNHDYEAEPNRPIYEDP